MRSPGTLRRLAPIRRTTMPRTDVGADDVPLPVVRSSSGPPTASGATFSIGRLDRSRIGCVLAVISGKGGVGKTFVTAYVASELSRDGAKVGVLDADITGPSIARVFGVAEVPRLNPDGRTIEPLRSKGGVYVMSMASVTASSKLPLIWRGPMVNSAIRGLYRDTAWPELDYLLVDLPPGTSDAPMTVFQSLDPDGTILVTAPTELSAEVVAKAAEMARTFRAPILGLIENMAYFVCPHGERVELFGPSRGPEYATRMGVPFLGSLPISSGLPGLSDAGRIEEFSSAEGSVLARRLRLLADRVARARRLPDGPGGIPRSAADRGR